MTKLSFIITGASNGIGAALAKSLSSQGHNVIGVGRHYVDNSQKYKMIVGDVCDEATLESVKVSLGNESLSGLILNAGESMPITRISDMNQQSLQKAFDVSFKSPLTWIQAFLPQLRQSKGRLLYTSTGATKYPLPAWGLFAGIRGGMGYAIASLAKEEPEITALAFDPGIVNTNAFQKALESTQSALISNPQQAAWITKLKPNDPEAIALSMAKLITSAPHSKSGSLVTWNETWISQL